MTAQSLESHLHARPFAQALARPITLVPDAPAARPRRQAGATVAYQGAPGAYGEAAIAEHWNGSASPVSTSTFASLLAVVADGGVDFGVVPVWNSTIGPVREACDALADARGRVVQVGEVTLPVRHALLALPGASIGALRAVGSHRAALAQCGAFLAAHTGLRPVVAWDTAGAAAELAALGAGHQAALAPTRDGDRADAGAGREGQRPWHAGLTHGDAASLGVIASEAAAVRHGLQVLARDIQDEAGNVTRFAIVRTREVACRW